MKLIVFFLLCIFLLSPAQSLTDSSYVLPYPSAMPGTIYYKLHVLEERIMKYWYFGDIGQFSYNLKEADKYLVEAKTLFEYKQFLLGAKALQMSDAYFSMTLPNLQKAKIHGKNTTTKRALLHEAALKHIEILAKLINDTPSNFVWQPEKTQATSLHLNQLFKQSIRIRDEYL